MLGLFFSDRVRGRWSRGSRGSRGRGTGQAVAPRCHFIARTYVVPSDSSMAGVPCRIRHREPGGRREGMGGGALDSFGPQIHQGGRDRRLIKEGRCRPAPPPSATPGRPGPPRRVAGGTVTLTNRTSATSTLCLPTAGGGRATTVPYTLREALHFWNREPPPSYRLGNYTLHWCTSRGGGLTVHRPGLSGGGPPHPTAAQNTSLRDSVTKRHNRDVCPYGLRLF